MISNLAVNIAAAGLDAGGGRVRVIIGQKGSLGLCGGERIGVVSAWLKGGVVHRRYGFQVPPKITNIDYPARLAKLDEDQTCG